MLIRCYNCQGDKYLLFIYLSQHVGHESKFLRYGKSFCTRFKILLHNFYFCVLLEIYLTFYILAIICLSIFLQIVQYTVLVSSDDRRPKRRTMLFIELRYLVLYSIDKRRFDSFLRK